MTRMAKSIFTLSNPLCLKRSYCLLNFTCPNTASGSIGCLLLCSRPSGEVSRSLALRLYFQSWWFTFISRVGVETEVGDKPILCLYLYVISGLGLPVIHFIFFHTYESGRGIRLGVTVAIAEVIQLFFIFPKFLLLFFQFADLFLPLFSSGILALLLV